MASTSFPYYDNESIWAYFDKLGEFIKCHGYNIGESCEINYWD